jgi:hypothetical protein
LRTTFFFVIINLWMAACIPMSLPPQLAHQPGPGIRVTDRVYDSGRFQAEYPDGWIVVTSAAGDAPHVIFAAPDGEALIMLGEAISEAPAPAGASSTLRSEMREVALENSLIVRAILNAPAGTWSQYEPLFTAVLESIRGS